MKLLISLLLAVTAIHAWKELFHPPFLEGLSWTARDEYYMILFNRTLTIAEQKEQIMAWAKKYNIQGPVQTFFEKKQNHTEEMMQNFTKLIDELPKAVANLTKIMKNKNQTFPQLMKALQQFQAKNPSVYSVLKFAMEETMQQPHGGHPPPPNPFGGPQPWHDTWDHPWDVNWNGGSPGGWPTGGPNNGPHGGWPTGGPNGGLPGGWPNGGENDGHGPGGWPMGGEDDMDGPGGWPMGEEEGETGQIDPWQRRFGGFQPGGPQEFGPRGGF